ncbi:hypothetical protein ACQJ7K_05070 [Helicobacter pylori]|uniref:hypothetical protein n=1 Tax=Helicobacter pylori TaxID=210 RepID=UPI000C312D24|nr:hypothetical protein [Helicobacter pylori]
MENSKTNTPTICFLRKNGKHIEILDYHGLIYEILREKLLEYAAARNKMDDLERKQKLQKETLELGLTYEDYKKQIEQNRVHEGLLSF